MSNYIKSSPTTLTPGQLPPASAGPPTLIDPYNNAKQAIKAIEGLAGSTGTGLGSSVGVTSTLALVHWGLALIGSTTGAYHGYKRNDSVGWGIGWYFLGAMFPEITIPVSLAQGFGKRAK